MESLALRPELDIAVPGFDRAAGVVGGGQAHADDSPNSSWKARLSAIQSRETIRPGRSCGSVTLLTRPGILVAAVALFALFRVMAWQEWANVVLGSGSASRPGCSASAAC